jgi:hypothetical protein
VEGNVVPPHPWQTVLQVGRVGIGLTGVAALLGLVTLLGDDTPWPIHTARLLLVFVGAIIAGAAVSMRPDLGKAWALGGLAALLAVPGTPAHWDSFRLVFGVLTAVAALGVVLVSLPPRRRLAVLSAMIVFHFIGIFLATVSPAPSPWLVDQTFSRVYAPYLQFVYLRNAYHFYSPQPGPASLIVFLLKTEVGNDNGVPRYEYQWVVLPTRPKDVRDPLALSYVRRLSLTEQTAAPGMQFTGATEQNDVILRRRRLAERLPGEPFYPFHPGDAWFNQYRAPRPDISRYVLPSYAQHVLLENTPDTETAGRTSAKVYRLEHETLSVHEFRAKIDPYHPATYRAYCLGEYRFKPDPTDPAGRRKRIELDDPQEKMLYWLVPVIHKQSAGIAADTSPKDYLDFLSAHALSTTSRPVTVEDLDREPYKSLAFNWSQLR